MLGFAAFLLAGCGGVFSEHPASDDATTRLDESLIGFWRLDQGAEASGDAVFVIGKRKPPAMGLELVAVGLDEHGVLSDVSRQALRATTIAGKPYVSVDVTSEPAHRQDAAENEAASSGWWILRYEVPEPGVLHVFAMDEKAVKKDVVEKRIAGTAPEPKPDGSAFDWKVESITLSASTPALRAWLEARGDALFPSDTPLVFRRLEMR
jgi:hypothetical protein